MWLIQIADPLTRLWDVALSLGLMAVGLVVLWKYFQRELTIIRDRCAKREEELESRISDRDDMIQKLNDEKQELALDVVRTLGSFQTTLDSTNPLQMRDEIIAKLTKMREEILAELRRN